MTFRSACPFVTYRVRPARSGHSMPRSPRCPSDALAASDILCPSCYHLATSSSSRNSSLCPMTCSSRTLSPSQPTQRAIAPLRSRSPQADLGDHPAIRCGGGSTRSRNSRALSALSSTSVCARADAEGESRNGPRSPKYWPAASRLRCSPRPRRVAAARSPWRRRRCRAATDAGRARSRPHGSWPHRAARRLRGRQPPTRCEVSGWPSTFETGAIMRPPSGSTLRSTYSGCRRPRFRRSVGPLGSSAPLHNHCGSSEQHPHRALPAGCTHLEDVPGAGLEPALHVSGRGV